MLPEPLHNWKQPILNKESRFSGRLFKGKVAGVRVVSTSGEPGAGVNVTIRGVGSIRSGSTPLFVVDGMPLSNDDVSPGASNVGFGSSSG
jgi:hypothetical protein